MQKLGPMGRALCVAWALMAWTLAPLDAQIVEDDLTPEGFDQIPLDRVEELFEEALGVFRSADQLDSLDLFTDLIQLMGGPEAAPRLDPDRRWIMGRSLFYRAEVQFNMGMTAETEADLRRAIRVEPTLEIDLNQVSPKLAELFEETRQSMVGYVEFFMDPIDAAISVDGKPLPRNRVGPIAMLAGARTIEISRPGFETELREVEIAGGQSGQVSINLKRTSAVARFETEPAGTEVYVDGVFRGKTAPSSPEASEAEVSAELLIAVEPGTHTFEFRKDGYRSEQTELEVTGMQDYYLPGPISLLSMRGSVILAGIPSGSTIEVDGAPYPERVRSGAPMQIQLSPGRHVVAVDKGATGRFEQEVEIEDGQTLELNVRLSPVIALMGILGGDEVAARELRAAIRDSFGELEQWTVRDVADRGPAMLAPHGLTAQALRDLGLSGQVLSPNIDWNAVQKASDEGVGAPVYLLAVLADDLFANEADLWLWASAPTSSVPTRRTVTLGGLDPLSAIVEAFAAPIVLERPWFGAQVLDSQAAEGPIVYAVPDGSPAGAAGVRVGDVILAVDGETVGTGAELRRAIDARGPGAAVRLTIERGGRQTADVKLGTSPSVISPADSGQLLPVVAAQLAAALTRTDQVIPQWLLQLNQAAALLGVGDFREAVTLLRGVQPPANSALGQGLVDYWMGRALLGADPAAYTERARDAFRKALEAQGARLYDLDGPLVAPRARARLNEVGG